MSHPASATAGSRTAAYLVAGALATFPAWLVIAIVLSPRGSAAAVMLLWISGLLWLLRKRQEEPTWDRDLPAGR